MERSWFFALTRCFFFFGGGRTCTRFGLAAGASSAIVSASSHSAPPALRTAVAEAVV
jgi:hypothetical protein